MASSSATTASTGEIGVSASFSELARLLKPGVMTLVVFTGAVGLLLAPGHIHPFMQLLAVACIALGSGAGALINMWYDRDIDAIMLRTQRRPLPQGRAQPDDVLTVGIMLAVISVGLMGLATNWLAAGVLAFAIFFYAVIYTMLLKRSTDQNIVIGGAAGAFPPVIGWVAITGDISIMPLILFAIIFLWTPPHFWALALFRNEDYRRASIPMMPVQRGAHITKRHMLAYTLVLIPITLAPALLHTLGFAYVACASLLGGAFLWHALRVLRSVDDGPSKKMFAYSIFYLFALFSAMLMDRALVAAHLSF